jgi:lipopolysaccharide export system permease protein
MATITRYVVAELVKVLVLWLGVFTMLLLFVLLAAEMTRSGIGPLVILRLVPCILPQTLVYAIPATSLLSVCVVYGRMSAANEVVAIKSLGIGPAALAWPAVALSFVLSLVCVWLNDIAFSWGELEARRVIMHSVEEIIYGTLRTHKVFSNKRLSIIVREVDDRTLVQPVISIHGDDVDFTFTVTAAEAELRSNLEENTLTLILVDSVIEGGNLQGAYPGRTEQEIPLSFASMKGDVEVGPSHLSLRDIPEAITAQRRKVREQHELLAAEMGFYLVTGDMLELNEPAWHTRRQKLQSHVNRLHRLRTELPRRTASGFMCLFFTLVGVPLAIRLRNSDVMTTFFLCFGPVLLLYFPIFAYCVNASKAGQLPPFTIWIANVVCLLVAYLLWQKVDRY